MGKGDSRLHARTQADADTMAAKWAATFRGATHAGATHWQVVRDGEPVGDPIPLDGVMIGADETAHVLTDAERDAMWRAGTHIQRGRDK